MIFWSLLRSGLSMNYHDNLYFINIKIIGFAPGVSDDFYSIEISRMLHKGLAYLGK